VQILISPLSGDEGIAVKNFSRTHPELTFINAASGAQETTFPDPSPNFFRWNMDGAQWRVGLGDYAYNNKGYRKIATVGEDYSFVYTQVEGLVLDFCRFGGQVTNRHWVPLGTKDFASTTRCRGPRGRGRGRRDGINPGRGARRRHRGARRADRVGRMDGPVRFFLPEGGVSALDAPGQPFHDPESDAALIRALDQTVRQTTNRQLIRIKRHINDPEFASAVVTAFRALNGRAGVRKRAAR
jgi:hypothetical protein